MSKKKQHKSEAFAAIHETMEALHRIGAIDKKTIKELRLDEIAAIKDEDIDYSDIPELDNRFWANAQLRMPDTKDRVTIRKKP